MIVAIYPERAVSSISSVRFSDSAPSGYALRWARGLPTVGVVIVQLTDLERAVTQVQVRPRETELLICLNHDGTLEVDRVEGAKDRAELTDKMKSEMNCEGVRLWHNHPSRGSLSSADWRLLAANVGILSIAAVNDSGTVFRGSVQDRNRLDPTVFDDAAGMAEVVLTRPLFDDDGVTDMSHLGFLASHLANQQANDVGMVSYAAQLSDCDQRLWESAQDKNRTGPAAQAVKEHFDHTQSARATSLGSNRSVHFPSSTLSVRRPRTVAVRRDTYRSARAAPHLGRRTPPSPGSLARR